MRQKFGNLLWGIAFIIAGIGFAGKAFNLWDFSIFFDGWWTLFIIVPSVISIVQAGFNAGNTIGILVGSMLLLSAQGILDRGTVGRLIFPGILVVIGLSIVFRGVFNKVPPAVIPLSGNGTEYTAIFSSQDMSFAGQVFTGANITSIFGGVGLDLRGAIINEDCVIYVTTIFGGADILVPPNIKVKVSSTPIFGGVANKTIANLRDSAPTLYLNCTCIFGGVEIK